MPLFSVQELRQQVLDELKWNLSPQLTYHSVEHTMDVIKQALAIAAREQIDDTHQLQLIEMAALFHDTGFLTLYKDHETVSCQKAQEELLKWGFSSTDTELVCNMIESTRIPQQPKTILDQIIADADLDYLGREDFFEISELLKKEFIVMGITDSEQSFEILQLRFFEQHHYCTFSSRQLRTPVKLKHYEVLKSAYNEKYKS